MNPIHTLKLGTINPLIKTLSDKRVVWFEQSNNYVLMNPMEANVLRWIFNKEEYALIRQYCMENTSFSDEESDLLIQSVRDLINLQSQPVEIDSVQPRPELAVTPELKCSRFYRIHDCIFLVDYETKEIEYQLHPKFAHLEIEYDDHNYTHFQVFTIGDKFVLKNGDTVIGRWDADNFHYLTGKFFMLILNTIYRRNDGDWLGVFHASAMGNGHSSILFTGRSGSGKSSISAILMNQGYQLIADDFVPLNTSAAINFFPAALSIKKSGWDTISKMFPEMNHEKEFHYREVNKTVKYLAAASNPSKEAYPVKAIVLVKYQSEVTFNFERIQNEEAFQELVPDSWLSPLRSNADQFLDWFITMPCYRLTYSDNEKMVARIEKLFQDDK